MHAQDQSSIATHLPGSRPVVDSGDTVRAGSEAGCDRTSMFRHRIRRIAYRADSLLSSLGFRHRPLLHEIVRELDSLLWRIRMLRNRPRNLQYRYFCVSALSHSNSLQLRRNEERYRMMDTLWLRANYPAASATDIYLFQLGMHRRALRFKEMEHFLKEDTLTENSPGICT